MKSEDFPVVVMIPGDLHLTAAGLPNHKAAIWAVEQANNLIRPDFVQFIGDNVQDAMDEQFQLFDDLTVRLDAPWYALVGDHDVKGDQDAAHFRKWVGDPRGSLSLQGFRFLRLNTQEGKPVGLSAAQLQWFGAEVDDAMMVGQRVIVFQHNYPYQIWEDFAGPGLDKWRMIVQSRRIHGIFCGHTHYWQVANDGRNVHVATRSIGDPEGGPPGYTLLYLRDNDLAVAYRTTEDVGPLVIITSPRDVLLCTGPDHVVRDGAVSRARIWSHEPIRSVWGRVDDGPPFPLQAVDDLDWSWPLEAGMLAKGTHRLLVAAEDRAGVVGERIIDFAVDPTGRYTAVPRVHPVVAATNFC